MNTIVVFKTWILTTALMLGFLFGTAQTDSTSAKDTAVRKLEKGHPVYLILVRDVGSSVAQAGNKVYFELDSAITVSGITVVPKETKAYGTVISAKQASTLGFRGKLAFTIDRIELANGKVIPLTADYKLAGRSRIVESQIGSLFISDLFAYMKGKNVTFKEEDKFIAYILNDYPF